ncbi:tRNAHis guanylyltransferase [Hondaea fermentalgiana]|uniref:tRNA(His) guanylyltransferase n=1 Tax=Hondaea fermentalgiana TaxID=2315210 RepID=A0A2R5GBY4_9STRA|nr:tRNAHis guanylyltransferase [Hondaea fermentalgiana]|eukprot:GBG28065.1 tRNAHis guanylyltransferase [Hondaea fermentalgiana]
MAHTSFEYVRKFEDVGDVCLPSTYIVVRLDGRGFTKFTKAHDLVKPNDKRALDLMNRCGVAVMEEFGEIALGYGQSDEFSFVFRRDAVVFKRRKAKILSLLVSLFSSAYVFHWATFFPQTLLQGPPQFDARIVLYPTDKSMRDYFRWRQADCHINNLFNTAFWALVHQGARTPAEAEAELSGTLSQDKHEIMFSSFGINYNNEPAQFRKGSVLRRVMHPVPIPSAVRAEEEAVAKVSATSDASEKHASASDLGRSPPAKKTRLKRVIRVFHEDIIQDTFWEEVLGKDA